MDELVGRLVDDGPFGGRVWSDEAPPGTELPYAVVYLDIADSIALQGDGVVRARRRQHQVSVFEDAAAEDPVVVDGVVGLLDGWRSVSRVKFRVVGCQREPSDQDGMVAHRAIVVNSVEL